MDQRLNATIQRLAALYAGRGHQLYLVGGSVRDLLMGRPPHDLDFTTDAPPPVNRALCREAGLRTYPLGEKFGTIGVIYDQEEGSGPGIENFEITTFRAEGERLATDDAQPVYGTTLTGDLSRRDFTINAIALEPLTGSVIDPFDGRGDLEKRVLRTVGRPADRFSEDPLRLLRATRFAADLELVIETETWATIQAMSSDLQSVSRERIGEELTRAVIGPHPARALTLMGDAGLLPAICPDLETMRRFSAPRSKDLFAHVLKVVEATPSDLILRLAALFHDIAKPATYAVTNGEVTFWRHEIVGAEMVGRIFRHDLRLDMETARRVRRLVEFHLRPSEYEATWTDGAVRRLIREAGEDLERLLALSRADITSKREQRVRAHLARLDELAIRCQALIAAENIPKLESPLDGNELMALFGQGPGRWVGEVKSYLLNLVLEGKLAPEDKEGATLAAQQWMNITTKNSVQDSSCAIQGVNLGL